MTVRHFQPFQTSVSIITRIAFRGAPAMYVIATDSRYRDEILYYADRTKTEHHWTNRADFAFQYHNPVAAADRVKTFKFNNPRVIPASEAVNSPYAEAALEKALNNLSPADMIAEVMRLHPGTDAGCELRLEHENNETSFVIRATPTSPGNSLTLPAAVTSLQNLEAHWLSFVANARAPSSERQPAATIPFSGAMDSPNAQAGKDQQKLAALESRPTVPGIAEESCSDLASHEHCALTHQKDAPRTASVASFINAQIQQSPKKQVAIAAEAGFAQPNMITMIKQGKTQLPIAKIPAMAKALDVDPTHLLRLCFMEYRPEDWKAIEEAINQPVLNETEKAAIQVFRTRYDSSRGMTEAQKRKLGIFLESL